MKSGTRKIYYKVFCTNHSAKIKIDVTDIFTNTSEISYCLEILIGEGKPKRYYDYSLKYYGKNGEFLVFLVFDVDFCADLQSARLTQFVKDKCGKIMSILYSFELNLKERGFIYEKNSRRVGFIC